METIEIIAIIVLVAIIIAGIQIKRFTKKSLNDIDGMGEVSSKKDSTNSVAKF